MEFSGYAQVKIRGIRKNCKVGPDGGRSRQQFAVLAVNSGDMGNYFDEADHRQAGRVDHGANTGGTQAGPVQPKKSVPGRGAAIPRRPARHRDLPKPLRPIPGLWAFSSSVSISPVEDATRPDWQALAGLVRRPVTIEPRRMSIEIEKSKLTVEGLGTRFRGEMIPLTGKFSYFSLLPIAEEDLRQYLNDPIAAISPAIVAALPPIGIILAPYVEKGNGKGVDSASFERPSESRHIPSARSEQNGWLILVLGVKDIEVADYHYQFYNALAGVVAERWPQDVQERFFRTIREELSAEIHGEVDEKSWHLKQALLRRQTNVRKETKLFREYARQAFEDTLTLVPARHMLRYRCGDRTAADAEPLPAAPAGIVDLALPAA